MDHDSPEFKTAVKEATVEAVKEVLITLGIDTENPLELQADMLHVRRSRETTQQVSGIIRRSLIGVAITGGVSLLVMAAKEVFK